MIADHIRADAYAQALRRAVGRDSVVLDMGCGTGIFSLLACQYGARRVFALEPDNAIQVARETARANALEDRITFLQEFSTRVTLPEKVDVIISDLRGMLPVYQHHIPAIIDARTRHLKPDGTLIPQRDIMHAAVVEANELYGALVQPWEDARFDLDLTTGRRYVLNTMIRARLAPESLLTAPQSWLTLDYALLDSPNVVGNVCGAVRRKGIAHGILIWYDAVLSEGIGYSNSPAEPELIYGSMFFPWLKPVAVQPGDQVSVDLHANLIGEGYVWQWSSRVLSGSDSFTVKAEFQQSSFYGIPLVPEQLHKRAINYSPALGEEGAVDHFILSLMGTDLKVGEMAARLCERFPARFSRIQDALHRVGELSQKYSR